LFHVNKSIYTDRAFLDIMRKMNNVNPALWRRVSDVDREGCSGNEHGEIL
jgi:hypothetical protein